MTKELDLTVMNLGECRIPSPMPGVRFVNDDERIIYQSEIKEIRKYLAIGKEPPHFEEAGAAGENFL